MKLQSIILILFTSIYPYILARRYAEYNIIVNRNLGPASQLFDLVITNVNHMAPTYISVSRTDSLVFFTASKYGEPIYQLDRIFPVFPDHLVKGNVYPIMGADTLSFMAYKDVILTVSHLGGSQAIKVELQGVEIQPFRERIE